MSTYPARAFFCPQVVTGTLKPEQTNQTMQIPLRTCMVFFCLKNNKEEPL